MIPNQSDLKDRNLYKEFYSHKSGHAKVLGSAFWEHQRSVSVAQDILVTSELSNSLNLGSKASDKVLSHLK